MRLSDFVSLSSAAPGGFQPECAVAVRRERVRRNKLTENYQSNKNILSRRRSRVWATRHDIQDLLDGLKSG